MRCNQCFAETAFIKNIVIDHQVRNKQLLCRRCGYSTFLGIKGSLPEVQKEETVKLKIKKTRWIHQSLESQAKIIQFANCHSFYRSKEWRIVRKQVLKNQPECQKCKSKKNLQVDHIKPRSKFPHLALQFKNLQTLCQRCNFRKGASLPRARPV